MKIQIVSIEEINESSVLRTEYPECLCCTAEPGEVRARGGDPRGLPGGRCRRGKRCARWRRALRRLRAVERGKRRSRATERHAVERGE